MAEEEEEDAVAAHGGGGGAEPEAAPLSEAEHGGRLYNRLLKLGG